jgi:hypothetical protein
MGCIWREFFAQLVSAQLRYNDVAIASPASTLQLTSAASATSAADASEPQLLHIEHHVMRLMHFRHVHSA